MFMTLLEVERISMEYMSIPSGRGRDISRGRRRQPMAASAESLPLSRATRGDAHIRVGGASRADEQC